MDAYIILGVVALLGFLSKNATVWVAAVVLIILKAVPSGSLLTWTNQYGLKIGITVLTMGVLAPVVLGKITLADLWLTSQSMIGIAAVAVGIFVAYLGGRGTGLLTSEPHIVTGLLAGTIVGVALFRGVPVGPLIAAGILALFADWMK
ncbi:uncharacterized membrane protein (DUF441 family) [Aneurinibacillus soli]|uniref:UPF0756 membrane protein CB4_03618 n=1 Tax=Aneurinibacillus soli TaxID=1500254 RepID=A0A0U5B0A4_9BACL|nr:DUF441 domain-containing protein [Aneurinibacillus soli]PYE59860.1 uncharacterized membrane protein (DUF441 family) [Aneurinibacillus soli]BAU29418.1 hypothetical protein CB4_03618 [Aneurinibacillus soli]